MRSLTPSIRLLVLLGFGALAGGRVCAEEEGTRDAPPMDRFATNRPRLFLSADTLPGVMQMAVREQAEWLNAMRDYAGRLAAATNRPPGDYGVEAAVAAFLYLADRTPERLSLATDLLAQSIAFYRECDRSDRVVSHYSTTRIHAITAYDWLYDAMPPDTRAGLGRALLAHVERRLPGPTAVRGDNQGDFRSGFYGEPSLLWYVGIATRGTGLDEEKSVRAIALGYELQMRLLRHRSRLAGDDGGGATSTLGYALRADPWAEFNFFHTMRSAFGLDIAPDWPYLALFPNYVLWNRLPDNREFGSGDASHLSNELPDHHLYTHLLQIRHFYGRSHLEQAALAAGLQGECRRPYYNPEWPLAPFLLTELDRSPPPLSPPSTLSLARHFEGMGQIFMRSGWGADDTYALFTAGGLSDRHKHFDENTFTIFHQGFLALDSGARPEPGSHFFQYSCRTVAHNGVLIRMEGERLPSYWGTPAPSEPILPVANDGGMCSPTGAVILAFRTTPDYTYIASDATACYHPGKCLSAIRQFVHLQPDLFIIFDRVRTVKPENRTTWLLQTAEEPRIQGDRFLAEQSGGRLWCRTFLPRGARLAVVGGPGREFWSDGRNWPLPAESGGEKREPRTLFGGWRVEVTPFEPATDVLFLHVIEAGGALAKTNPTPARLVRGWNWTGLEFRSGGRKTKVLFRKNGDISCEIRIHGPGKHLSETLGNTIQPQSN